MSLTVLVGDRGALSAQLEGVHGEVGLRWKGRKLEASHVGDANFFPPSRPVACSRRCRGTVPCDRVLITAITPATILPALPRPVWCLSDISIFFPPKFNVLIYVHQCPPPPFPFIRLLTKCLALHTSTDWRQSKKRRRRRDELYLLRWEHKNRLSATRTIRMRRCTCLFIFLCPAEMICISASVVCVCVCLPMPTGGKITAKTPPFAKWHQRGAALSICLVPGGNMEP